MTMHRTLYVLLTTTALVLGAMAAPVAADEHETDRPERPERPEKRERDERPERNETDHPARPDWAGKPAFVERCTGTNASSEDCKLAHKEFDRRNSSHGHFRKAVAALEHRITQLEVKEYLTEQRLMQPNLTANQTAAGEARLERIEAAQDEAIEKLLALKERWRNAHDRPDEPDDDSDLDEAETDSEA